MVSATILTLPDFSKPFIVETNTSGTEIVAMLTQGDGPIAYFSQNLSERTTEKSMYERELMAIVMAVHKWRHYLLGRKFVVRTD